MVFVGLDVEFMPEIKARPGSAARITVFDTYDDIVDTCSTAWNYFANDPKAFASVTSRSSAQVN
jgi:hypothetical protein